MVGLHVGFGSTVVLHGIPIPSCTVPSHPVYGVIVIEYAQCYFVLDTARFRSLTNDTTKHCSQGTEVKQRWRLCLRQVWFEQVRIPHPAHICYITMSRTRPSLDSTEQSLQFTLFTGVRKLGHLLTSRVTALRHGTVCHFTTGIMALF